MKNARPLRSERGTFVTIDEIKELIEILSGTDIAELTVESDGVKLSIKKGVALSQLAAQLSPPAAAPVREAPAGPSVAPPSAEKAPATGRSVAAPMVGTFYRAPSPDAEPYVKVGDQVEVGQPLCIIEAMKLMNEIESEVKGRVAEILVENGQPVEYGQPLFIIEPA